MCGLLVPKPTSYIISSILALNHLSWTSGLSDIDILLTINATLTHKFEQRRILKPVEHLRQSFLAKQLTTESDLFSLKSQSYRFLLGSECNAVALRNLLQQAVNQLNFLSILCFIYTKTFEAHVKQVFQELLDLQQIVLSKA